MRSARHTGRLNITVDRSNGLWIVWLAAVGVLIGLVIGLPSGAATTNGHGHSHAGETFEWTNISEGDVLLDTAGVRGACDYPAFTVTVSAPQTDGVRRLELRNTEDCEVKVQGKGEDITHYYVLKRCFRFGPDGFQPGKPSGPSSGRLIPYARHSQSSG